MPNEEVQQRARRRAWWLKVAREHKGLNQAGVAEALGMSRNSASTVGDWERMVSEPSLRQLELLAVLYGVPLRWFTDPPMTDDERLDELEIAAGELEREDWEAEGERGPAAVDALDGEPRTQSA